MSEDSGNTQMRRVTERALQSSPVVQAVVLVLALGSLGGGAGIASNVLGPNQQVAANTQKLVAMEKRLEVLEQHRDLLVRIEERQISQGRLIESLQSEMAQWNRRASGTNRFE